MAGAKSTEGGRERWDEGERDGATWVVGERGEGGGELSLISNARYFINDGFFKANCCLASLCVFAGVGKYLVFGILSEEGFKSTCGMNKF
jgi:hypothetical protein